jgi:hypothetical protein
MTAITTTPPFLQEHKMMNRRELQLLLWHPLQYTANNDDGDDDSCDCL